MRDAEDMTEPTADDTLLSVYARAAAMPAKPAFRCLDGTVLSWAEMAEKASAAAASLPPAVPGRPVFLTPGFDADSVALVYGLLAQKRPAVLLSPKLTESEQAAIKAEAETLPALPAETGLLIFTSGTTGRPKGVLLSRRALAASGRDVAAALHVRACDVFSLSLSPARAGGLGILLRSLATGCSVAEMPKFHAGTFFATLAQAGVTYASVVPAMLADIFEKDPDFRVPEGFRSLLVGGAGCPARLRSEAAKRRLPLTLTYGLTETASAVALTDWETRFDITGVQGGIAVPPAEVSVIDGQLCIRGDRLFSGYWGRPSPFDSEGWFAAGDAGTVSEDGLIRVLARTGDLINTGGEKVVPGETEAALLQVPGVREALVFGIPDAKWGQLVGAMVVAEPGTAPQTAEAVAEALRPVLARWKWPRRLAYVEQLPRTREGKPDRRAGFPGSAQVMTLHTSVKAA